MQNSECKMQNDSSPPGHEESSFAFRILHFELLAKRARYCDMYSVSDARGIRHVAPIFLPFKSPDSSTVITSASETPSVCAASAGLSSSGSPPLGAAPALGTGGT